MHHTSRRLAGGLLALTVVTASACSSDAGGGDTATAADSAWEFTDDLGNTVTLEEAPTRVAGLNDVLSSLWNYGIEPVAAWGQTSIEDDVAFEGKDLSGVEIVGTSYGQIDLEQLAAADPDVIVASVYPTDSEGTIDEESPLYGFESIEQQEQVAEIAPIIGIVSDDAQRLCADGGARRDPGRRPRRRAGHRRPRGLRGSVCGTHRGRRGRGHRAAGVRHRERRLVDGEGPGRPVAAPLRGPRRPVPFDPGGEDYFWNSVGWEEVPNHPSDVLLYSLRFSMSPAEIAAQPTAALLPAVQAGQLYPWKYLGMDYVAQAEYMTELAGSLTGAQQVT